MSLFKLLVLLSANHLGSSGLRSASGLQCQGGCKVVAVIKKRSMRTEYAFLSSHPISLLFLKSDTFCPSGALLGGGVGVDAGYPSFFCFCFFFPFPSPVAPQSGQGWPMTTTPGRGGKQNSLHSCWVATTNRRHVSLN